MKIAFLYAGQGSQKVGMGRDLYEQYPTYKATLDGLPQSDTIKTLSFDGPAEQLSQTKYTQPCMVAFAAGVTALLRERGILPEVAAGLSLGEYSALHAAGVFTAEQAVDLVWLRGAAMEEAARGVDCKMSAILGGTEPMLREACEKSAHLGVVEIANLNCPGQVVISGERIAVEQAEKLAVELGAKRALPLDVSGPFHTSFMKPAGNALAKAFGELNFGDMAFPVVFNATGTLLQADENIPALLEQQVQSSVYFEKSIRTMLAMGVDTFVEIGPGKALGGFVKRINAEVKTHSIENAETLEAAIQELERAK